MRFPVVVTFPVHWGEMDALGHVNHARFLTWLETARIELCAKIGVFADGVRGVGPILANVSCDYLRPVQFPAIVSAGVRVRAIGRTSLTMEYAVWLEGAPESPVARATTVVVLIDYATMAKVPVSDDVRAAIAALEVPAARTLRTPAAATGAPSCAADSRARRAHFASAPDRSKTWSHP